MSEYIVLRLVTAKHVEGESRIEIGRAAAATPKAAIKATTDGKPAAERTGTFVATPVRSWQPVPRKVEQAEREVWG